MRNHPAAGEKPVVWVGSSKRDLLRFPATVVREVGAALSVAQFGETHRESPARCAWRLRGAVWERFNVREGGRQWMSGRTTCLQIWVFPMRTS